MSQINIDSLPYPMFKTTAEEKEILIGAKEFLLDGYSSYVCDCIYRVKLIRIEERDLSQVNSQPFDDLCDKIDTAILSSFSLIGYFYHTLGGDSDGYLSLNKTKIRETWINKLLEYTGE